MYAPVTVIVNWQLGPPPGRWWSVTGVRRCHRVCSLCGAAALQSSITPTGIAPSPCLKYLPPRARFCKFYGSNEPLGAAAVYICAGPPVFHAGCTTVLSVLAVAGFHQAIIRPQPPLHSRMSLSREAVSVPNRYNVAAPEGTTSTPSLVTCGAHRSLLRCGGPLMGPGLSIVMEHFESLRAGEPQQPSSLFPVCCGVRCSPNALGRLRLVSHRY